MKLRNILRYSVSTYDFWISGSGMCSIHKYKERGGRCRTVSGKVPYFNYFY